MRLIIAAILGGLALFMWSAFSHMVIGLGDSAYKQVPNESAVIEAMRANITEPGFYFIPGFSMSEQASPEAMAALEAKVKAGPNAILVYDTKGAEIMPPSMLATELASNIAAAFVTGLVLMFASVGFGRGVMITTLIGLIGWLSINVSTGTGIASRQTLLCLN